MTCSTPNTPSLKARESLPVWIHLTNLSYRFFFFFSCSHICSSSSNNSPNFKSVCLTAYNSLGLFLCKVTRVWCSVLRSSLFKKTTRYILNHQWVATLYKVIRLTLPFSIELNWRILTVCIWQQRRENGTVGSQQSRLLISCKLRA